jgi:PAS domain S-box-containing protein
MTRAKQMQAERDRILEVSQDMICIAGMDGYFKYLNPAWEKNLGYTDEELLSRKFLDFIHPDDRAKTKREFESLATGLQTIDFDNRYAHRDGSFRHISWKATPLPDEERVYAVGRDVTERKQIERKYRTVADFTYDWEYWANLDGTLEYVSPSCERISGYSVQDFMENPSLLRDIIVPEDRGIWDQHMHDFINDLAFKEVQFRIKNKDGDIRWIEHACRPVLDDKGRHDSLRASNRDITARKQIEVSLQASRKKAETLAASLITTQEAERARLARELHDDITQRLAFLNIEMDKLEIQNQSLSEPVKKSMRQIGEAIGELSSDIHMISRQLHPSILDDLGLTQAIETECNNFTRLRGIPVTLDLDGTLQDLSKEICLCIYRILQEGLRNIAQHAKATDIQVMLSRKDDTVHFMVKDNGKGFDPASNEKNPGLGMASMAERARLIQGDIDIESRPGQGMVIKLKAPFASR